MSRRVSGDEIRSLWAVIALIGGLALLVASQWLPGLGLLVASAALFLFPLSRTRKTKTTLSSCPKCGSQLPVDLVKGCSQCRWPYSGAPTDRPNPAM